MKVLSAAGRVADWIILLVKLNENISVVVGVRIGSEWSWNVPVTVDILGWGPSVSGRFFTLIERVLRVSNILISTEVWHKVVRLVRLCSIRDGELVFKLLLCNRETGGNGIDILIFSKVWYEVIHFVFLLCQGWGPRVSCRFFTLLERVLGVSNILISTEVWHKVVLRVSLWCVRDSELVIELLLCDRKTRFRGTNILILTKVWHEVIHWMSLLLWVLVLSATG